MPPKKKKAGAHGYKFAEAIPQHTILEDILKNRWRLGPSIGKGGFGEIYSAAREGDTKVNNYCYAVKIEPHANGPLFVEINFYIRFAKPALITAFKQKRGLKTLGLPEYCGSGSHTYKEEKYRFLVLQKFGSDLCTLYKENNKIFPTETVFKIGIQLVDVLEYIHECGYVHGDIKPANILMGTTKETENKQVYLADFGIASKYSLTKEFKPNHKKAHDGTIEYLSRDAHKGVPTRRGDLEILAYNLIQWLGCSLPWEENLDNQDTVQNLKEEYMTSASKMIKGCFSTKKHPKAIMDYLAYLQTLQFDSDPDYIKIRNIFTSGVEECGGSIGALLKFSVGQTPSTKRELLPLSVNKSGNKKVKQTDRNLGEPSGYKVPKPQTKGKRKATNRNEEEKAGADDQSDDDQDNINLTPKLPIKEKQKMLKIDLINILPKLDKRGRKQTTEDVAKTEKRTRKEAAEDNKYKSDLIPKPGKRGRNQTATKGHGENSNNIDEDESFSEEENTDLAPKLAKRGRKQTASKDGDDDDIPKLAKRGRKPKETRGRKPKTEDEDENVNQDGNTDTEPKLAKRGRKPTASKGDKNKNDLMSKPGRKVTAIKDGKDDLMPKPAKRGKKQAVNEDDEDNNSDEDNNAIMQPKPEKREGKKGGAKDKEDDKVGLTPKRLTGKGIRNLELDLEHDNDSPEAKPKATRKYGKKRSLSLTDISSPIADPFAGYNAAMKEIMLKKMEKDKANQKKGGKKLEKASSSTDIPHSSHQFTGYTAEMKEIALKKKAKAKRF